MPIYNKRDGLDGTMAAGIITNSGNEAFLSNLMELFMKRFVCLENSLWS